MSREFILRALLLYAIALHCGPASSKEEGVGSVVPHSSLPPPAISSEYVMWPFLISVKANCVPTSVAMVLKYMGEDYNPVLLKRYAEEHKPTSDLNTTFTLWRDMDKGLQKIGKKWKIYVYPATERGFEMGMNSIRRSLDQGNPSIVNVDIGTEHSFVVVGYNDLEKLVYIRDPYLNNKSQSRILSYPKLMKIWHQRGPVRGVPRLSAVKP